MIIYSRKLLAEFTLPSLIIQGVEDTTVQAEYSRKMINLMPKDEHLKLVEISDTDYDFKNEYLKLYIEHTLIWLLKNRIIVETNPIFFNENKYNSQMSQKTMAENADKMNIDNKTVSDSKVLLAEVMLPEHANPAGNVHGGTIMKIIDNAALIASMRHTRMNCVTASVDRIDFISPVFVGNLLSVSASINYTSRTSMEIGARVEAECMTTGRKTHVSTAYLTFVALDKDDNPAPIPQFVPSSEEEKRRHQDAQTRREYRIQNRKKHRHSADLCLVRTEGF
jgi:uncharacterized protein (TIGR00369 family)